MHTEHLRNVRIGYVLTGWLIAIASTSLCLFALIGFGVLDPETPGSGWITLAVAVGFALGGTFVGLLTGLAPILHGILIALTSLLAWAILNAVVSMFFPDFRWTQLSAPLTVNIIIVQIMCAILGTRFGYRFAVARET